MVKGPTPYVIGTQIRHNEADLSVTMVDTVAATTGSLFFNASPEPGILQKQDWSPLPEGKRPTRAVLQAAIDGYLDLVEQLDRHPLHPLFGTPCERVEGSRYVTPCTNGVPTSGGMKANSMRRYVIDEVIGSAEVLCSFTSVGDIPDSHEIRIEDRENSLRRDNNAALGLKRRWKGRKLRWRRTTRNASISSVARRTDEQKRI